MPHLTPFTLATDWAPSANHAGFYLARVKGYYAAAGLRVSFAPPGVLTDATGASLSPAAAAASGAADAALCPSESIISLATRPAGATSLPRLVSVAAVLQRDASTIAVRADSGIASPAGLDGKDYASYGARYEGRLVAELVRADGGVGAIKEVTPPHAKCFDAVVDGRADATWIFPHEAALASVREGVALTQFSLTEAGIPYGYSPCVAARASLVADEAERGADGAPQSLPTPATSPRTALAAFLTASARGWQEAAADPLAAARALVDGAGADGLCVDGKVAEAACAATAEFVLDAEGAWGRQDGARWTGWVAWLQRNGLLTSLLPSRAPVEGVSASLDDLRCGAAGDPCDAPPADELWTNDLLDGV